MRVTAVVSAIEEPESDSLSATSKPRKSVRSAAARGSIQGNKFVIRLPANLRKKILLISRRHHRSMNSEIIHLLGRYLEQQYSDASMADPEALESQLSRKLKALSAEKREALLALLE